MSLHIVVLGPGGVGGLLAALLARSGNPVLVIAPDETARTIAQQGLRVESTTFGNFDARVDTATRLEDPVDACLVAVKATHLDEAIKRVPAAKLGSGLVVPFLNGIEHVDRLREVYPPSAVVAGTIRIETTRVTTGVIHHASRFAAIELAAVPATRERVDALAAALASTGLKVQVREDEANMLWEKYAVLVPLALLTTDERAPAGEVRARRAADLAGLVDEVVMVARADGADIDVEKVRSMIASVHDSMETSMQRDQAAGRPMELDALGGALLRRAHKAGLEVPIASRLVADLAERSLAKER